MKEINIKNFSPASAENEINMLSMQIELDKEYSHLSNLDIINKAKREIMDRIKPSINKKDTSILEDIKSELFKVIANYFQSHQNSPRCPFDIYADMLRLRGITPNSISHMIVKNDGALHRWEKKIGEWDSFSQEFALKRIKYLNSKINEYYESKSDKSSDIRIFNEDLLSQLTLPA